MNNRIKCILFLSCFLSLNSSLVTFKDLQEQTKHFKNLSHYEMSTLLAKTRNYIFEKSKNENQSIKKDDNEKSKETLYKEPFDDDELLFPDRKLLSDDEKNLHENFLQRYLKDTKDEKNEYVRYFFYNIDRLINTFRLKHIIKLTSTSDYWQVPETWIRKSSQENELKLVSEKIEVRENDLVFNLNSIQAFVLLAFSTGFTDLHRANTLYDFKAKKYSFVDVEDRSFMPCNLLYPIISRTGISKIDIIYNILASRLKDFDLEAASWAVQLLEKLAKDPQEWESFRKGKNVVTPLHCQTQYDKELFGFTPNKDFIQTMLIEKKV